MDVAAIIGIVGGLGLIVSAIGGESLVFFVSVPSVLIVGFGTISAVMVNYPMKECISSIGVFKKAFLFKQTKPEELIPMLVDFGKKARSDGILVLQNEVAKVSDPFILKGIQLAIDGMEPPTIMKILENEIEYIKERHKAGYDIILSFGTFAPAFGMIGTLVGLVLMLQQMDDPSKIGPAMSLALITTFYGAVAANLVFMPLAGKLQKISTNEMLNYELSLEAIVSIASGDNPRIIEQKLHGFLSPHLRKTSFS